MTHYGNTYHWLWLFFVWAWSVVNTNAAPIDSTEARHIADEWFAAHSHAARSAEYDHAPLTVGNRAYVFATEEQFLLVGKEDNAPYILGYGTKNDVSAMPRPLQTALQATSLSVYPPIEAQWHAVEPLLATVRHQHAPYNNLCPYYTDDQGTTSAERCIVGCVATALEQILTYYKRVYTLQDTLNGWTTEHYTIPDILPGESVDSRIILNNYDVESATDEEKNEVARLCYWLGTAVHMNWGLRSSGAHSTQIVEPLSRAFGFKYANYLDSYAYSYNDYWNYLAREIMARRPVYYAGYAMQRNGHAFVLDGLDEDGLFHVNWGEGGGWDGYFRLDVLFAPAQATDRGDTFTEEGFFCNQEAVTLCPDEVSDNALPDTLSRTGREIAIEKMWLADEPRTNTYTRVFLALRNTTDRTLTTPFALLLNSPTDTARLEQADWLAYTGRTLLPQQRDTLCVHARLSREGQCILSVTPDGLQVIDSLELNVQKGSAPWIEVQQPTASLIENNQVRFLTHLANTSATERTADVYNYCLQDNTTGIYVEQDRYIYLASGTDTTLIVNFVDLVPGRSYTLTLYRNWARLYNVDITMPDKEDSVSLPTHNTSSAMQTEWYTTIGVRTNKPSAKGVYLRKRGKEVTKYLRP